MSFFFGNDLWDEMNRMQRQLEDLSYEMDYKRPRLEGAKKCQKGKALSPFKGSAYESFNPITDLAENDDSYVVSMDLPGVKKDELNVSVHNGILTVSGTRRHKFSSGDDEEMKDEEKKEEKKEEEKKEEKKPESQPAATAAAATAGEKKEEKKEEKKPKHRVIRMESYCGSFERSISVPFGTTTDDVKAKFEDGVLTITIAKHKKDTVKKIEIQ